MPQEMSSWYCNVCRSNKLFVQNVEYPNHAMHALLSLLCCGWWLWVWLIVALIGPRRSEWMCTSCGCPSGFDPAAVLDQQSRAAAVAQYAAQAKAEKAAKVAEKKSARAQAWADRKERFNAWFNGLEQEQRIAMIAAPAFVLIVLGGLAALLWTMYG